MLNSNSRKFPIRKNRTIFGFLENCLFFCNENHSNPNIMIELDENFGLHDLANEPKDIIEDIEYNKTRVSSYGGQLIFTRDKVYFLVAPSDPSTRSPFDFGDAPKSWCIDISEIESHRKYGLAGYLFKLHDGKEIRFTNVFRKHRNSIIDAIEERMN